MIQARDKVEPTFGYANLLALTKLKIEVKANDFNIIKSAYTNDAWNINEHQFKKNHPKLSNVFKPNIGHPRP